MCHYVISLWIIATNKGLTLDNISDQPKLKAFEDNKVKATGKLKFVLGRVENIVGKGENASCQHFLLFQQCFQKTYVTGLLRVVTVWQKVNSSSKNKILDLHRANKLHDTYML